MILLFLVSFYLGVDFNSHSAYTSPLNDYRVNVSTEVKDNRFLYELQRQNGIINYAVENNSIFSNKQGFSLLENSFDRQGIQTYREDLTCGLKRKINGVDNYFSVGMSMNKYVSLEPCFRYGFIYNNDVRLNNPMLSALTMFFYSWKYQIRGNVLYSANRYEYGLEASTKINLSKVFGWQTGLKYFKYNEKEWHSAFTNCFVSF